MENQEIQTIKENRLITKDQIKFAENLNLILEDVSSIKEQTNPIIKEIMFANAKSEIESLLTDEMLVNIYKLFGDPSGVKTDGKPFNKKSIFVQACMMGLSMRGQQFNVLGGNLYIRAQGYLPKLRNFPNLFFVFPFRHHIPVKDATNFTTTVTTDMEWTLNGKLNKETITYPVARQDGQGNDAILGKATTKMCCWLWNKVSGEDTVDDSGIYTEAEVTKAESGTGEKIVVNIESKSSSNSTQEKGEDTAVMVNEEFQGKFDNYISKAIDFKDLIARSTYWCGLPKAKEIGVVYSLSESGVFLSPSLDLKVFNELALKFSNPS